jgi:hypothetical protein
VVIDQFEELFTSGFSKEIRQDYIRAIERLVRSGRVFVLATLRSDFYSSYQQYPELIELANPSGKVDLRPPSAYEIGNMVRLPAEAGGLRFEQESETGQRLDQALRDAASSTPESLPLAEKAGSKLLWEFGMGGCKFHSLYHATLSGRFHYTSTPTDSGQRTRLHRWIALRTGACPQDV